MGKLEQPQHLETSPAYTLCWFKENTFLWILLTLASHIKGWQDARECLSAPFFHLQVNRVV